MIQKKIKAKMIILPAIKTK